ncbi:MAG: VOC family protein [Proteobacteria bacterium]|nr:VOC family protein [Pseudomonadota bacterium]MCH8188159.1 VOC family protein [Pseudomonadota bacterium]
MSLNSLQHFLVRASNLDDTRTFYEDVLGLRDGDRPDFPFPGHWLYLGDVPVVHLVEEGFDKDFASYMGREVGEARAHGNTGPIDHIAFDASDLEGMRKRIAGLGIDSHEQGIDMLRQIFIRDPNGITIELNFLTASAAE